MTLINKYFNVEANCDGERAILCFHKEDENTVRSWKPEWIGTLIVDLRRGLYNEGMFSLLLPSVRAKAQCFGIICRINNLDISKKREEELAYIEWACKVVRGHLAAIYGTGLDDYGTEVHWDLGKVNSIEFTQEEQG